jgi:hypothetical protein
MDEADAPEPRMRLRSTGHDHKPKAAGTYRAERQEE